jgi:hypothetical protein
MKTIVAIHLSPCSRGGADCIGVMQDDLSVLGQALRKKAGV